MIQLSKQSKGWLLLLALAVLVGIVVYFTARQTATFALDTGTLDHVVYVNSDTGPVTLDYAEHQALLDEVGAMLTGDYIYVGRWNHRGISGGGPDTLRFYDENKELLGSFCCHRGYWAVEGLFDGIYRLYRHENGLLDLSALQAAVDEARQHDRR